MKNKEGDEEQGVGWQLRAAALTKNTEIGSSGRWAAALQQKTHVGS